MSILIIEDDTSINNMLEYLLKNHGYEVKQAFSGTEGLLILDDSIDLVLLDLMLPGKTGEEIIREIKKRSNLPVIVMSAIDAMDKKLNLFALGADDYVTKPFNNDELLARIKVHLKKANKEESKILSYKDIILDLNTYQVTCNKQEISLPKHEFLLLKALMENKNQVLTKSNLFSIVWDTSESADDNTLNVHISKLRNKLKECNPNEEYIETIWSIGYRLKK